MTTIDEKQGIPSGARTQVATIEQTSAHEGEAAGQAAAQNPDTAETLLDRQGAERLCTRIQAHAAHIAEAMCAFLLLVAEFDRRGGMDWYFGLKSTAHWLAWCCSMSSGTAREHVRVARALAEMPLTVAEFSAGRLSFSKVREMTRVAGRVEESALLEMARAMTAAQLARTVAGFRAADGSRMPQEAAREGDWRTREDGIVEIRAVLPAEVGAEVVTALELAMSRDGTTPEAEDGTRERDFGTPLVAQRKADAFLELARAYRDAEDADRSGEDRHLVLVHVTPDVLEEPCDVPAGTSAGPAASRSTVVPAGTATESGAERQPAGLDPTGRRDRCGIVGMGPLEAATARRLACTGMLALLVTTDDGEILHLGRTRRLASPAQRRALHAAQQTCQFPGCHQSRHLDAHHLVPWSQGGSTDIEDLVLLCRRHHMLVHEGGLSLHRLPSENRPACARRFEARDSSGRAVHVHWPELLEQARISPVEVQHPVIVVDAEEPPLHWGESDTRVAPTTAGFGFQRADAVDALLHARPAPRAGTVNGRENCSQTPAERSSEAVA